MRMLKKQENSTRFIYNIVSSMIPFDEMEKNHIEDTLLWVQRGDPLFRITSPDIPKKHLVSYFVVFDESNLKILLTDHKKAQLWIPTGGHVEIDENPQETARRECAEELGIEADFWCKNPIFLTSTVTGGLTPGHTDVSLWYVLKSHERSKYHFDKNEFNDIKWFGLNETLPERIEPHLKRFIEKLKTLI